MDDLCQTMKAMTDNNDIEKEDHNNNTDLPQENVRATTTNDLKRGPLAPFAFALRHLQTSDTSKSTITNGSNGNKSPHQHVRLITIGASHYCEKARWALDLAEEDDDCKYFYTEDAHPPAFASYQSVPATNGTSSSVPVAVVSHTGEFIGDSTLIMKRFRPQLYPESEILKESVETFEEYLDKHLGPSVRVVIYHNLLTADYYPVVAKILTENTSKIESFLFNLALERGLAEGMRKLMKVDKKSCQRSIDEIRHVFEKASNQLGEKQFLFEDRDRNVRFTAADLTLAALSAPILLPPSMKRIIPIPDNGKVLPSTLLSLRDELRATPAGKHVMNMYKNHRPGIRDDNGEVTAIIKSVGRNRALWRVCGSIGIASIVVAAGVTCSKL